MMDTEAFREFKTGLTLLRDNYAVKALPHMKKAVDLDRNNPYYMSYLGVVLARSEQKWGEAERLCDTAVRMKRNQAQLYLNLAEVYATAGRRDEAVEALAVRAEICAARCAFDDRHEPSCRAAPSRTDIPDEAAPDQSAAGNHPAQDFANVRTRLISSSLQPQSKKGRVAISHPPLLVSKNKLKVAERLDYLRVAQESLNVGCCVPISMRIFRPTPNMPVERGSLRTTSARYSRFIAIGLWE